MTAAERADIPFNQQWASFSLGRSEVTTTPATQIYLGAEGSPTVIGPVSFSISAYHGTPHKVDKFSLDKIGTGEGAQAYGWGLYFAANKSIAEKYQKDLSGFDELTLHTSKGKKKGALLDDIDLEVAKYLEAGERAAGNFKHNIVYYAKQMAKANGLDAVLVRLDEYGRDAKVSYEKNTGNLYSVTFDVEPEDLLDYDGQITESQKKLIAPIFGEYGMSDSVNSILRELSTNAGKRFGGGSDKKAALLLMQAGIPGLRFLDGNSRSIGEGTHSYVIFDESKIKITAENGQPVKLITDHSAPNTSFSLSRDTERFANTPVTPENPVANTIQKSTKMKFSKARKIGLASHDRFTKRVTFYQMGQCLISLEKQTLDL